MDWAAVQAVALMMPANAFGRNPRLEEAIEFLKGPDFIPPDSQPAQVEFNGPLHFRFPTPQPCDFTENNVVHGRLYRCPERWQERPVIILLPVVMASPAVRFRPWVEQRAVQPRIRGRLQSVRELCEKMNLTAMNLTMIQPAIPREKILLIEGVHDLICSRDDIEDLWQAWGQPDIWRLPHGHVGICCGGVPGLPGRVLRWLSPRLNAPTAHARPTNAARECQVGETKNG